MYFGCVRLWMNLNLPVSILLHNKTNFFYILNSCSEIFCILSIVGLKYTGRPSEREHV